MYKGDSTEKVISNALFILKKIIIYALNNTNAHIDISNTILFNIDTDFDEKLKFGCHNKPQENIVFLNCKLENVDFSKTKFHFCKFIDCDLEGSKFSNANLWGTKFIKCDFKDVKFDNSECEGVEFTGSTNLVREQVDAMEFKNKKCNSIASECKVKDMECIKDTYFDNKKLDYLIIYDKEKNPASKFDIECFTAVNDYIYWKNNTKETNDQNY